MPNTKSVYFFATRDDILSLCKGVEAQRQLLYAIGGNVESADASACRDPVNMQNFGVSRHGDLLFEDHYIILEASTRIVLDAINRSDGSVGYFIGQHRNPDSIDLQPAGQYGADCVIQGLLATISATQTSLYLYSLFLGEMKKCFRKIRGVFVSPGAFRISEDGGRLTQSVRLPRDSDFQVQKRAGL